MLPPCAASAPGQARDIGTKRIHPKTSSFAWSVISHASEIEKRASGTHATWLPGCTEGRAPIHRCTIHEGSRTMPCRLGNMSPPIRTRIGGLSFLLGFIRCRLRDSHAYEQSSLAGASYAPKSTTSLQVPLSSPSTSRSSPSRSPGSVPFVEWSLSPASMDDDVETR